MVFLSHICTHHILGTYPGSPMHIKAALGLLSLRPCFSCPRIGPGKQRIVIAHSSYVFFMPHLTPNDMPTQIFYISCMLAWWVLCRVGIICGLFRVSLRPLGRVAQRDLSENENQTLDLYPFWALTGTDGPCCSAREGYVPTLKQNIFLVSVYLFGCVCVCAHDIIALFNSQCDTGPISLVLCKHLASFFPATSPGSDVHGFGFDLRVWR